MQVDTRAVQGVEGSAPVAEERYKRGAPEQQHHRCRDSSAARNSCLEAARRFTGRDHLEVVAAAAAATISAFRQREHV